MAWRLAASLARIECAPAGEEIYRQGDPVKSTFFLERGLVKLSHVAGSGREIIVDLRGPGEVLGLAPVLLRRNSLFTATMVTACSFQRIPADFLVGQMEQNRDFCKQLQLAQSRELVNHFTRFIELAGMPARERFERLLRRLAQDGEEKRTHGAFVVPKGLRHWEIAQLLTITPAYLSRMIRKMQREGVLVRQGRELIIPELSKLSTILPIL